MFWMVWVVLSVSIHWEKTTEKIAARTFPKLNNISCTVVAGIKIKQQIFWLFVNQNEPVSPQYDDGFELKHVLFFTHNKSGELFSVSAGALFIFFICWEKPAVLPQHIWTEKAAVFGVDWSPCGTPSLIGVNNFFWFSCKMCEQSVGNFKNEK